MLLLAGAICRGEGHLEKADVEFSRGEYDAAFESYGKAAEARSTDNPDAPHALAHAMAGMGAAEIKLGRYDSGAARLRRAASFQGVTGKMASACLALSSDALHMAGKHTAAAVSYLEAAKLADKGRRELLMLNAAASWEAGMNPQKAEEIYKELSSGAEAQTALLRMGALLERENRLREAEKAYRKLLEVSEEKDAQDAARLSLARIACKQGLFGNALSHLGSPQAESAEALLVRIISLYGLGRGGEAAPLAAKAASSPGEDSAPVLFWLALYSYNQGLFDDAVEYFASAAKSSPSSVLAERAGLLRAASAFRKGDYVAANAHAVSFAAGFPTSRLLPKARLLQAKALANLARFEDAVVVLDDLVERFPASPEAIEGAILRGDALAASSGLSDRHGEAALSYAAALSWLNPGSGEYANCLCKLAVSLARDGSMDDAHAALDELSRKDGGLARKAIRKIYGGKTVIVPAAGKDRF